MKSAVTFAGVGGAAYGEKKAGADVAWTCEIDEGSRSVLMARFPDIPHYGDIRDIDPEMVEAVDCISGGTPCQDLSVGGAERKGLAGERSGLFLEYIRVVRGLIPRGLKYAIWENVPGALTSNKGEDFAYVLAAFVGSEQPISLPKHKSGRISRYSGVVQGPLGAAAWRVLDAQHFGVPQRRRRLFVVLSVDTNAAIEALFPEAREAYEAGWDPEPDVVIPTSIGEVEAWCFDDGAPFNTSPDPEGFEPVQFLDCLEPAERVDDKYVLSPKACEGYLKRSRRGGAEMPHLLNEVMEAQAGGWELEGKLKKPVTFQKIVRSGARDKEGNLPAEVWAERSVSSTLNLYDLGDKRAVDIVVEEKDGLLRVRRLTPVEYERLTGLPDEWTDPKGTARDSARYKGCGNACVSNVAEWISRRIKEVDDEAQD